MTGQVLAHGPASGSELVDTLNLLVLAGLVATAYSIGTARLTAASSSSPWRRRRVAFHCGLLVLVVALLPSFEDLTGDSFPAHMAQHMVVLLVAAPLLALGAPGLPLLVALPTRWRRRVGALRSAPAVRRARSLATAPLLAVTVHTAVIWAWHLPVLYTAALASPTLHAVEHLCYLAVGLWFWTLLATTGRHRLEGGLAVLFVFLAALPMSALGALLTLAPRPLYPEQSGLGAQGLADQQLAGLIMWLPPDVVYLSLCAVLMLRWLRGLARLAPDDVPLPPPVPPALPEHRRPAAATTTSHAEGRR
jgi:putative membrane protein